MRKLTSEERKDLLFAGLLEFRRICEKENLTYWLMYGTLLGAVRHGGFIPWDDDIDVGMPRKDYERLLALAADGKIESEDWEVISWKSHKGYCFPWAKFCNRNTIVYPSRFHTGFLYGQSVDIFIIDNIRGADQEEAFRNADRIRERFEGYKRRYHSTGVYQLGGLSAVKRFVKKVYYRICCMLYGKWEDHLRDLEREIEAISDPEASFVTYIFDNYKTCIYERQDFFGAPAALTFRGETFPVPSIYGNVLRKFYGDYMTLPPAEKQVPRHTAEVLCVNGDVAV